MCVSVLWLSLDCCFSIRYRSIVVAVVVIVSVVIVAVVRLQVE